jgi:hypothetical protein
MQHNLEQLDGIFARTQATNGQGFWAIAALPNQCPDNAGDGDLERAVGVV